MMNKSFIFGCILGAAIGSIVTWQIVKAKYEQIAKEEIESVKETFSARKESNIEEPESDTEESESDVIEDTFTQEELNILFNKKPDISTYVNKIKEYGYTNYADMSKKEEEGGAAMTVREPYVIAPDEFGDGDGYDAISLTYYADGVVTDDWDEVVSIADTIGADSLNHFGEYEEDTVYVRNDEAKAEYEITRDLRTYSDVTGNCYPEDE